MVTRLTLNLPWLSGGVEQQINGLCVRRGRQSVLTYEDGIELAVRILDPAGAASPESLIRQARAEGGPGRVVLVAGAVPLQWRAALREAEASFLDVSGVMEITWPRLRVSARRFGRPLQRHRTPMPLQKGHGLIVQELLIAARNGARPSITSLAEHTGASLSTASRAISQLAEHGLVRKQLRHGQVSVELSDHVAVAEQLASQTRWPGRQTLPGYLWGRTVFDMAEQLSGRAASHGIALAVTGRVAAAFLGVLGTSTPSHLWCWVHTRGQGLADVADLLGLEPAPEGEANVLLSADQWRVGVHGRREATFDEWTATVADPLRVWCDLHSEPRGTEFAAQLWGAATDAR